jgi:molybdenum cofactor cytidylyltransferase
MKFGTFTLSEASGVILAHGVGYAGGVFKKGRVLSADDIDKLAEAGRSAIIGARLDAGDVPEDSAAHAIALAACGKAVRAQEAFTGRANLHSAVQGVLIADVERIRALNHLHESLTLATLANYSAVKPKQMIATVKVIPFAVPKDVLDKALQIIGDIPLLRVEAFQPKRAGLIITRLAQTKASIIAKSEAAIRSRLAAIGASLFDVVVCDHVQAEVQAAIAAQHAKGCNPILLFGASAIVDRADVIPAALSDVGGHVVHLGMPVDPGNLLMLGRLNAVDVVGVPSCARSPKTNGFDWVLERIIADVPTSREDLMDMGAGGLLAEISSRPQPREQTSQTAPHVVAIVLAAGKSSRMGANKMLVPFRGAPLLQSTIRNVLASSVDQVIVVTGQDQRDVEAVLDGFKIALVHNPDFEQGLATSLAVGVKAAGFADAIVVCLGDMPLVDAKIIDRLIAAYNPLEHRTIVVPTHSGQLGNPVLWGRDHFEHLAALDGDKGARSLIEHFKSEVVEIEAGGDSVLRDADTPEALRDLAATDRA